MAEDFEDFYNQKPDNRLDFVYIERDLLKVFIGPPWKEFALCRTEDARHIDKFSPEAGTHGGNHLIAPRKLCLECPVRYDCLDYGLDEPYGVWGGHSPSQRRRISSMMKKGSSLVESSEFIDIRSRDARRPE